MQSTATLSSEAPATRTQRVADEIRLEILRNVLPPGTRITEEGLAERYGLSRTPVREALRLLTRESLLIHVPRAYYEVSSVNLDEMDDLYTMRGALEERVAERIARGGIRVDLGRLVDFWSSPPPSVDAFDLVDEVSSIGSLDLFDRHRGREPESHAERTTG